MKRSVWVVETKNSAGKWAVFHPCCYRKQAVGVVAYRNGYDEDGRKYRVVRYDASK